MHELHLHGLVPWALARGGSIHPLVLPHELTSETGLMNPSVFVRNGQILVNIRHVNYTLYHSEGKKFNHLWGPLVYVHPENDVTLRTHNVMCSLDSNLDMTSCGRINMAFDTGEPTWTFIGLEDGRLFEWDDRLFLCGVRRDCYDDKGTGRMEMAEIDFVDGEWKEISRNPIPAPPPNETYCEKNWMPVLDMPWHFVKWCNPTEVIKFNIDEGTTETVVLDESKIFQQSRDIRGGSQVVRISPEHRMAFTHEVDLWKDSFNRKDGHYVHRIIVWDNIWNVVKKTSDFSFFGYQTDRTTGHEYVIEFVTGFAFHGNDVLISFGLQDNACYILRMPHETFTEFLEKA